MIEMGGKRGSGRSVLAAQHDDDVNKWLALDWIVWNRTDHLTGGACGVMVIVAEYGHGDTSSNPGPDWLHFT